MIITIIRFVAIVLLSSTVLSCSVKNPQLNIDSSVETEILDIRVNETNEKTIVEVISGEPLIYTTFRLSEPDRLIIDMASVSLSQFTDKIQIEQGPIKAILPTIGDTTNGSRLEFELSGLVETEVKTIEGNLVVEATQLKKGFIFFENETTETNPTEEDSPPVDKNITESVFQATIPPTLPLADPKALFLNEKPIQGNFTAKPQKTDLPERNITLDKAVNPTEENLPVAQVVKDIYFDQNDGIQLVVISDGELSPRIFRVDKKRLAVDLPGVTTTMKRHRVNIDHPQIKRVRIGRHPDKIRLVLDLHASIEVSSWGQKQNEFRITFKSKSETKGDQSSKKQVENELLEKTLFKEDTTKTLKPVVAQSMPQKIAQPTEPDLKILEDEDLDLLNRPPALTKKEVETLLNEGPIVEEKPTIPRIPIKPSPRIVRSKKMKSPPSTVNILHPKQPKYKGKRLSLDFQDADIKNIIRLIADVSKLNFVMGEDVKGKITLKLLNVPWDQALHTILSMNRLGQIREDNIIRIATLSNLAIQRDEEAQFREKKVRVADLTSHVIHVNYSKAVDLRKLLLKMLSPRGDIMVDQRVNTLIVKDVQEKISEITQLVKILDTKTPQVLIEARIVQVQPSFEKSLGIKWGADFSASTGGNLIGIGNASSTSPFNAPVPDFAVNLPSAPNFGGIGFSFGRLTQNAFNLDLRLSAGQTQGLTRIVSTPKISVLDNQEARIEQGESFPLDTTSQQGTQTNFFDANLVLQVTPHISSDGGIMMEIIIKKNAVGETRPGASGPSIIKKEAATNVLVMNGDTVVIGGIYETTKTSSTSGIPYLMNIPYLGGLFRTTTKRENTSELLVFITPTILD